MLKQNILLLLSLMLIISCKNGNDNEAFLITNNKIGPITNQTKISQIDSIYKNDSVVNFSKNNKFLSSQNEIEIFERDGAKLLIIEPNSTDNDATIKSIQVIDSRFQTPKGLSSNSVFKDIKDNYTISKINNTLSAAVIFVDSIQAYLTIDKKELPTEYRFNTNTPIEASKIPDSAKIKHFWISWDKN